MKISLLFLCLCFSAFLANGQIKKTPVKKQPSKKTVTADSKKEEPRTDNFTVRETQEARYKGTEEELVLFFMQNIQYDSAAVKANAEGQVMLSFMVNPDSTITNPTIIQKFGYNVDDQVARLVTLLKFIPAKMNGVIIRSNHIVSIPLRAYFH